MRVVHGQGQTDFVWAGADKGTGLRALAARLSEPGCALAVGDTASDLPLFECAALARAPRNASLSNTFLLCVPSFSWCLLKGSLV